MLMGRRLHDVWCSSVVLLPRKFCVCVCAGRVGKAFIIFCSLSKNFTIRTRCGNWENVFAFEKEFNECFSSGEKTSRKWEQSERRVDDETLLSPGAHLVMNVETNCMQGEWIGLHLPASVLLAKLWWKIEFADDIFLVSTSISVKQRRKSLD